MIKRKPSQEIAGFEKTGVRGCFGLLFFALLGSFCFWNTSYAVDCGLRGYDGDDIKVISCESTTTTTSPFRVKAPDGTMWGVSLVDLADPLALKFRMAYADPATGQTVIKAFGFDTSEIALTCCEELQIIGSVNARLPRDGKFFLSQDIDCSKTNPNNPAYAGSLWDVGYKAYFTKNGVPLGYDGVPASGDEDVPGLQPQFGQKGWLPLGGWAGGGNMAMVLDGRGHTISNLWADQGPGNYGDHGFLGRTVDATIKNLNLRNVHIYGNMRLGGLIGEAVNTTISNCSVQGLVKGSRGSVGGLLGQCGGYWCRGQWDARGNCTIENSYFSGTVQTDDGRELLRDGVGGLVGGGHDITVTKSYFTGTVSATMIAYPTEASVVGGLVGYGQNTNITDSFSSGVETRNGLNTDRGGLIGYHQNGTVTNSWWFSAAPNGVGNPTDGTVRKASAANDFYYTGTGLGGAVYNAWFYDAVTNPAGAWESALGDLPHLRCGQGTVWNNISKACQ